MRTDGALGIGSVGEVHHAKAAGLAVRHERHIRVRHVAEAAAHILQ